MKRLAWLLLLLPFPALAASTNVTFCTTAAVTPQCFTVTVAVPDPVCPAPAPCPVCPGPLPCPVCPICPAPVADLQAPSVPAGLTAVAVSSTQVNLSWSASTDNVGVARYQVYLNDVRIVDTTTTSFQHTGLTPGTTYLYRVSAADAVPNYSAWTVPVSATTPAVVTPPPPPVTGAPVVLYTDITSGPNSGGEGGNGTYLSVFGKNFGTDPTKVSVTVGGAVARLMYLGASNGKADVQQLSVQLGAQSSSGPVIVTVAGVTSNADQSFTVRPGRIVLASSAAAVNAALANPLPGDTVVVRGGIYSPNSGQIGGAFEIHNVGGTLSAPLALIAYPGERVDIVRGPGTFGTAIKSYYNAANGSQGHLVIAGFHIALGGTTASGIGVSPDQTNLRIVNNEVQGMYQDGGGDAAISTSSSNVKVLGNSVHDNGGSKLYHGLYFDSRAQNPSGYDIGWNHIWNQTGGRCIQIYGDTGRLISNVRIHDNLIHNCHLDAVLFGRDTGTGNEFDHNVVYGAADPALRGPSADAGASGGCLRIGNPALVLNAHHNTLADCALDGSVDSGAIRFESVSSLTLGSNIVSGKPSIQTPFGTWVGNVCFPTIAPFCALLDPMFVNPAARDYRLQPGSPAIGKGGL